MAAKPASAAPAKAAPAAAATGATHPAWPVQPPREDGTIDRDVGELLSLMQDLHELLLQETAALKEKDFAPVAALAMRKAGLTRQYEERITVIERQGDARTAWTEAERHAVAEASRLLRTAADANMDAMQAGITALGQVIDTVVTVSSRMTYEILPGYGETGEQRAPAVETSKRSLSFNNKV